MSKKYYLEGWSPLASSGRWFSNHVISSEGQKLMPKALITWEEIDKGNIMKTKIKTEKKKTWWRFNGGLLLVCRKKTPLCIRRWFLNLVAAFGIFIEEAVRFIRYRLSFSFLLCFLKKMFAGIVSGPFDFTILPVVVFSLSITSQSCFWSNFFDKPPKVSSSVRLIARSDLLRFYRDHEASIRCVRCATIAERRLYHYHWSS